MSNVTIRHCPLTYQCSTDWDSLMSLGDENSRFFMTCQSFVYWCDSDTGINKHLEQKHCVAYKTDDHCYVGKQVATYKVGKTDLNWD